MAEPTPDTFEFYPKQILIHALLEGIEIIARDYEYDGTYKEVPLDLSDLARVLSVVSRRGVSRAEALRAINSLDTSVKDMLIETCMEFNEVNDGAGVGLDVTDATLITYRNLMERQQRQQGGRR
jgi:hypothetical protein